MPKLTIRLTIALLTFLIGVVATMVFLLNGANLPQKKDVTPVPQERQGLRLTVPQDRWEPILFRSINQLTNEAKLPSLRTVLLPNDDFEVRIWAVGGEKGELYGVILQRSTGQWSAAHLYGLGEHTHLQKYEKTFASPKSGWEAAWERLVNAGLLTLPDASELQCNASVIDGAGYVVEINMNKTYRTYMYENPMFAKCNEAKQMITIAEIITEEFGWEALKFRE